MTDSGGVQEEAPSIGKPALVMRETTERPEAVEAGTVKLVGTDAAPIGTDVEAIVDNVNLLLNDRPAYERMALAQNPYGDGKSCQRIVSNMSVFYPVTGKKQTESHNERDLFISLQKNY